MGKIKSRQNISYIKKWLEPGVLTHACDPNRSIIRLGGQLGLHTVRCVHACMCVYACMHTCTCMFIHVCAHVCMHVAIAIPTNTKWLDVWGNLQVQ